MSKWIRRTHMYLALVLGPWVVAYALSTMVMGHYKVAPQTYTLERTMAYDAQFASGAGPREQAEQILVSLGLDGAFTVDGPGPDGRLTIVRQDMLAPTRVVYVPGDHQITVERGAVQPTTALSRFHHRRTYREPYVADRVMATSIDVVGITMLLWVASGLWMWWEMRATRRWGMVAGLAGLGLFVFFAWFV